MNYSREKLENRYNKGEVLKYIFFWGHTPNKDGSIGKSCFSQWWVSPFMVEGIVYKTAEHWMMAEKARLFNDAHALNKIIACNHPNEAKKWGRKVKNFDPKLWDVHKYETVVKGNYHKFSQDKGLKTFLLNTNDRIIVEASPLDAIWGIGMAQSNANSDNPNLWKGENLLGFALMEVRDLFKNGKL